MEKVIALKRERDTLIAAAKVTDRTLLQVEIALGDHWTRAKEKIGGDDWLAVFREAIRDLARYRWLRDGHAYAPEEAGCRGGDWLDELCDEGIAAKSSEDSPR